MIVFCTTCKNRTGHLRQTLPQNLLDNPKSKFVVLDYNSQDDLLDWLKADMSQPISEGRLVVYSYRDHPTFRMAHAKNLAHRVGILEKGDILVNLDADNFAGAGFEDFAATLQPNQFLWAHMVKGEMTRGISGRIAVPVDMFLRVGGYDEKFDGWGADDKDFNLRLQAAGYEPVEIPRQFLNSVPHNNKMRFKEYPHLRDQESEYFHMSKSDIGCSVVNGGRIGLGRVFRNFNESCVFEVVVTFNRIFGIGLHKTATTSLHEAMKILGFNSWHWLNAHSAKAIWQQMNTDGYSRVVDQYDALCDLPIPLLYKELDKGYPGSKFILTLRPAHRWIESVRRHYSSSNPFNRAWKKDPFTHTVHRELYGEVGFNRAVMLNRYLRHTGEVMDYFRDRPKDLHIMQMGDTDPWRGLCDFLGMPIPTVEYPRAYVSWRA